MLIDIKYDFGVFFEDNNISIKEDRVFKLFTFFFDDIFSVDLQNFGNLCGTYRSKSKEPFLCKEGSVINKSYVFPEKSTKTSKK